MQRTIPELPQKHMMIRRDDILVVRQQERMSLPILTHDIPNPNRDQIVAFSHRFCDRVSISVSQGCAKLSPTTNLTRTQTVPDLEANQRGTSAQKIIPVCESEKIGANITASEVTQPIHVRATQRIITRSLRIFRTIRKTISIGVQVG